MLVDIPDEIEFTIAAENLINSAWNSLIKLISEHEVLDDLGTSKETLTKYWQFAKPELTTALAMVQNAVEFYLKGKILSISPYLLISMDPRNLPKASNNSDVSFSSFRMLDAQDLIKVHNTFASTRLTEEFQHWFQEMRSLRNRIMHTVDRAISVTPNDLARSILLCHKFLTGDHLWLTTRYKYLDRSPEYGIRLDDGPPNHIYITLALHREISKIIKELTPADSIKFFNYDKKARSKPCQACQKIFEQNEYFDSKWTDEFIDTIQFNRSGFSECMICKQVNTILET
ncbi:hypothetical protein [Pseudomonas promysalinigenes]|uniref:hypothetical protein n=1 Tax=Pseudomonas promysalinigenes TaxID=485898 RepID=UPI001648EF9A|nr:hypothetical protein [Pseudomonas promysalinigenes]QXI32140.1 hypothetical protein HU725_013895 [Pseudomonas promysalinigenes]